MLGYLAGAAVLQNSVDLRLGQLAKDRKTFDSNLVASYKEGDGEVGMWENIYSMGPGEQHIYGFYPLGKSDRRYLIAEVDSGPHLLLYQAMRRGKPRTIWVLRLRPTKSKAPVKGTLATLLRVGYDARIVGKLTPEERQSLSETQTLAGYGYDGNAGAYAWIVQPNGREKPIYRVPETDAVEPGANFFPILPEEAEALGLGHRTWPPDLKLQARDEMG